MYWPYPIVFHEDGVTGDSGQVHENGVGNVDGDIAVKVVERGKEEAAYSDSIRINASSVIVIVFFATHLDVAMFVRVLGTSSE